MNQEYTRTKYPFTMKCQPTSNTNFKFSTERYSALQCVTFRDNL